MPKPSDDDLMPIDWAGAELAYRAGKPLRVIARQFGCSHGAVNKRAKRDGWERDLKQKIHSRADELVSIAAVSTSVSTGTEAAENKTVEANAQAEVTIRLGHRRDIAKARRLATVLMAELEAITGNSDLFASVHAALSAADEPALEALRGMAALVASLPARVRVMKDLAETLGKLIGLERESFGLNTASGSDGRPLVIIKDYCGRGDPDSPPNPAASY